LSFKVLKAERYSVLKPKRNHVKDIEIHKYKLKHLKHLKHSQLNNQKIKHPEVNTERSIETLNHITERSQPQIK